MTVKLVSGYIRMEQKRGPDRHLRKEPTRTRSGKITARGRRKTNCSRLTMTVIMPWLEESLEPHACSLPNSGITRDVHGAISASARRQSPDRSRRPCVQQLLVLLRHADRYRLGAWADPGTGPLDGAWCCGHLDARLRPAPLSAAMRSKDWQDRKGQRGLLPASRNPLPAFQSPCRTADQTVSPLL